MTYIVLISVDPAGVQLLPGMTATLNIITQQADNAMLIPNAAISWAQSQASPQGSSGAQRAAAPAPSSKPQGGARAQGNQPSVFVMQNGAPVRVPIQAGITDGVTIQVVTGLQAGDQVITGTGSGGKAGSSSSAGSRSIIPTGRGPGG